MADTRARRSPSRDRLRKPARPHMKLQARDWLFRTTYCMTKFDNQCIADPLMRLACITHLRPAPLTLHLTRASEAKDSLIQSAELASICLAASHLADHPPDSGRRCAGKRSSLNCLAMTSGAKSAARHLSASRSCTVLSCSTIAIASASGSPTGVSRP